MIISLGSDCVAKKRLEEYYYKDKTQSNLFDWVLSDFFAVCQILEDSILKRDIFTNNKFKILTKTVDDKYAISHKKFNFVSLHDAPITLSESEAIEEVCNKYQRRLDRFINDIVMSEQITFMGVYDKSNPIQQGMMHISDADILRFFRMLHTFNPLNKHKLILIVDSKTEIKINSDRLKIINSDTFINMIEYEKDWYRFYFNWEDIFDVIEKYEPKDVQ
jgi:hypothetical protein